MRTSPKQAGSFPTQNHGSPNPTLNPRLKRTDHHVSLWTGTRPPAQRPLSQPAASHPFFFFFFLLVPSFSHPAALTSPKTHCDPNGLEEAGSRNRPRELRRSLPRSRPDLPPSLPPYYTVFPPVNFTYLPSYQPDPAPCSARRGSCIYPPFVPAPSLEATQSIHPQR